MSLLTRLFGASRRGGESEPHTQLASGTSQNSRKLVASQNATRRELLRVVLHDTLRRHGIPPTWIAAEILTATSRTRETGIHLRLMVRHWDPRLMLHGVALQKYLISRVQMLDPAADEWLMGVSWQFALADESDCPAMPHPGSWTAHARERAAAEPHESAPGGSADVIAGPVHIRANASEARADLERLMAVRDADLRANAEARPGAAAQEPTQPMFLNTEPSTLRRSE